MPRSQPSTSPPPSPDAQRVGPAIRAAREAAELSLEQLAQRVACAKSYLSAVETEQRNPPRDDMLERIESALGLPRGKLVAMARWQRSLMVGGEPVRDELARWQRDQHAVTKLRAALEKSQEGGATAGLSPREVRRLLGLLSGPKRGDRGSETHAPRAVDATTNSPMLVPLALDVPLINSVAAGYPREFTDLGYPARIADEYVRCPDLHDPDAFAARVVGDSMEPTYHEGDIVIFSPAKSLRDGQDCFARIEPDHETTFKRVYFEKDAKGRELIRLQPLNNKYAPRVLSRELVAGLYAAVSVMRSIL